MKNILIYMVLALSMILMVMVKQVHDTNRKLSAAMANIKAYDSELSESNDKNVAYQLTIDQLNSFQDSILGKLNETKKELKIKDKKIQSLQYVESNFSVVDTLILPDTIFKEPTFAMDTLLGDEWYSVGLKLEYPSLISVNPEFKSEKHIIVSTKRETINPPKKFFLLRWFQKKHNVLQVNIEEKNPYIQNTYSKYVEVIK